MPISYDYRAQACIACLASLLALYGLHTCLLAYLLYLAVRVSIDLLTFSSLYLYSLLELDLTSSLIL